MSELSQHAKLIKAIEIAKGAQVGIELSYFDVLEVAGELNEAKEVVAMLNTRIAELEYQLEDWTNNGWAEDYKARIAELEGLVDELIEAGAWGAELAINIGALSGDDQYKLAKKRYDKWDALVKGWEERER
jgi:hypothetical protein